MTMRRMLRLATLAALGLAAISSAALAAQGPGGARPTPAEMPQLKKVKDDVYVIQNINSVVPDIGRFGGNVLVVLTPEGVMLVDAKNAAMHDDIMQKVRSLTPLPIKYVVLTHNHADHTGGAAQMKAVGATVVMSDADREEMARTDPAGLAQVTYSGHARLFLGGKEMQLTEYRGHTRGDTTVFVPGSKILASGDLVTAPDTIPGRVVYSDGGNWSDWVRSLDQIAKVDFDLLVPGHGPVLTKPEFMAFREKMTRIRDRVRQLNREGKSAEEIGQTTMRELNWGEGAAAGSIPGLMQELR